MKKYSAACVLLILIFPTYSYSQNSDLGNWLIYFGNKKIDSKWNWHHEVQYRNYNAIGDLEQLLLRTGLGYKLNNNTKFEFGYMNQFLNTRNRDQINLITFINF